MPSALTGRTEGAIMLLKTVRTDLALDLHRVFMDNEQ
jgi:hypothetical protein